MRKRKDGKIIASLTEVKNKTGDIFSLVDEFGEVLLTSYNKPKYKIVKISISESITLDEHDDEGDVNSEKFVEEAIVEPEPKSILDRMKTSFLGTEEKTEKEEGLIPAEVLKKLKSLVSWNKDSKQEIAFISSIKKSLQ